MTEVEKLEKALGEAKRAEAIENGKKPLKLFLVEVSYRLMVLAPNRKKAMACATYNAGEEKPRNTLVHEVKALWDVPRGFANTVPWEGTVSYSEPLSEMTVREFLARGKK